MKRIAALLAGCLLLNSVTSALPVRAASAVETMNSLTRNYENGCAILVFSPGIGEIYSYQSYEELPGAGLIRLPYACYICSQIDAGIRSLDETLTYTEENYQSGAGIIRREEYGTQYTVQQLLDYSLRYSDNIAFQMLTELFGLDGFNAMMEEWGYPSVQMSRSNLFPSMSANFMWYTMQKLYRNSGTTAAWQTVWQALCGAEQSYAREYIGGNVAVKYGNMSTAYNEVCYAENAMSYMLVIFSGSDSTTPDADFIRQVAACADELVIEAYTERGIEFAHSIGDLDDSRNVSAEDAAQLLTAVAALGAGHGSGLHAAQRIAADVNKDGELDAADAAYILQYAAYSGSGGADTADVYFTRTTAE